MAVDTRLTVGRLLYRVVLPLAMVYAVLGLAIGTTNTVTDVDGAVEWLLIAVFGAVYYGVVVLVYAGFEHLRGLRASP